jgi:electron transport complex protein RnfB
MDVYEALQEKLNTHPLGAPKREEFLEILRLLFAPEEAELALHLPFAPQRVDEIAAALGRPEEEVAGLCEQMADKTLLYAYEAQGKQLYMLLPTAPGLFEFPFMKNATSPGSLPGIDFERLARLWWQYHAHGWGLEMMSAATPAARVIPVQQAIPTTLQVFAYEEAAHYIQTSKYVGITECACRVTQKKCDNPTDVCMLLGYGAKYLAERGAARLVTPEEALQTLQRAEEAGLVHCATNTRDRVDYICNCCPCCCNILGAITRLEGAVSRPESNFYSTIQPEACTGCGVCVDRCPVEAITLDDVAVVDRARCIGCGLCVSGCDFEAAVLVRKADSAEPPANTRELMGRMAVEKGRAEGFAANLVAS